MAATEDQIAEVRNMVNEPTEDVYTDEDLAAVIEKYPLLDERGSLPYTWDTSSIPPTKDENENWIPTYDLNAAAGDVWAWKANKLTDNIDFTAVNQTFRDSQPYEHAMKQCRFYRARRVPGSMRMVSYPKARYEENWIGNLPEPEDE